MIDREKVVKGLECCFRGNDCRNCPYKEVFNPERPSLDCIDMTREDAIALLKEQEPVKPKHTPPKSIYSWECGVCAEPFDRIANYCPNCGRAVKWDD